MELSLSSMVLLICASFVLGGMLIGAACKGFIDKPRKGKSTRQRAPNLRPNYASGYSARDGLMGTAMTEPMKEDTPWIPQGVKDEQ